MLQLPFEHHYGLGSFRHLTFWHWTFQGRHFVSLDVSGHVHFGTCMFWHGICHVIHEPIDFVV